MSMTEIDIREAARLAQQRVMHSDVPIPRDRRRDVTRPPGPSQVRALRGFSAPGAAPGFMVEVERTYPAMAHLRLLGEHVYVLTDPQAIVDVFVTHGRQTMKGRALQGAKVVLGNGLLTSEGDVHLRNRRLVQPAFHRDRIAAYAIDMVSLTAAHEATWRDGETVDMQQDMAALTLAIVGRTLFGADLRGDAREVGKEMEAILSGVGARLLLGPTVLRIPTPARRRALEASARMDVMVQRIIAEHRAMGDNRDILRML